MKQITFTITLKTPVLISDFSGDTNTRHSLSYIPGSNMLGIIAGWLDRGEIQLHNLTVDHLVLKSSILFSDAVMAFNHQPAYPIPMGWYHLKGQKAFPGVAENGTGNNAKAVPMYLADNALDKKQPWKPVPGGWLVFVNEIPHQITVERVTQTHNIIDPVKGRPNEESGGVFVYEALKEGQSFIGEVRFEHDNLADQFYHAVCQRRNIRLGKSLAAEYGQAEVSWNEPKPVETPTANPEELHLVLASDAVLMGENGCYISELTPEWLSTWLNRNGFPNIKVFQLGGMVNYFKTRRVPGFNAKWGQFRQTVPAIVRGSVFHFGITGTDAQKAVQYLLEYGIGERRQEGYGRLIADHPLFSPNYFKSNEQNFHNQITSEQKEYKYSKWWEITNAPEPIRKSVFVNRVREAITKKISHILFEHGKLNNQFSNKPSNSQLQGLRNVALIARSIEDITQFMRSKEGKKAFKDGQWDGKIDFDGNSISLFQVFTQGIKSKQKFFRFLDMEGIPDEYQDYHLEAARMFIHQFVGILIKAREKKDRGEQ